MTSVLEANDHRATLRPTLDEFSAVLAAVEAFGKKMHPRKPRSVNDGKRLLAELREAVERVEAVWGDGA